MIIIILSWGDIIPEEYSDSILSQEDFVILDELFPISGKL